MRARDRTLWTEWIAACLIGEVLGIGVAGVAAAVVGVVVGEPATAAERWGVFGVMVGAGAIEGLALGGAQWRVLRRPFPALRARAWIGVTMAVAVGGWALGMLPSTLAAPDPAAAAPFDPSLGLTAVLAALAGVGAGLGVGAAQWTALRRHVRGASRWVWANALGWGLALAWIYVAASLPSGSPAVVAGLGVLAGALSGLSVGVVTGWTLIRLAARAAPTAPADPHGAAPDSPR